MKVQEFNSNTMPIHEIIEKVTSVCKRLKIEHLDLFGSFATETALPTSDIDFVVYGNVDSDRLEEEIDKIETLRTIDIFYYDDITNEFLKEDIKKYGKRVY